MFKEESSSSSRSIRISAFILSVLLVFSLFPTGLVPPLKASAATTHNINTNDALVGVGSGDWLITGDGTVSTHRIRVESGYHGTITLRNVNIKQVGSINKTTDTKNHWAAMRIFGAYNGDTLNPVTKVNLVLDGNNTLVCGSGKDGNQTFNFAAALQVDQGAQVNISAIDPSNNASGTLKAETWTSDNMYGNGAAIGAPSTDRIGGEYYPGYPVGALDISTLFGGGTFAGAGQGDVGTQGLVEEWYYSNLEGTLKGKSNFPRDTAGGNIVITSGIITTRGANHGAGIGGGTFGIYLGQILIAGGNVTAAGGNHSAGIGSGCPHGAGNDGSYSYESSIIVLPPSIIKATTAQGTGFKGLAGAGNIVYIGDKTSPQITVKTADNTPSANIYFDMNDTPTVEKVITAIGSDIVEVGKIKFGATNAAGEFKVFADFKDNVTIYTDSSSTKPETLGRPFMPVTTLPNAASPIVILPVMDTNISLENIPSTPILEGYTAGKALENSQRTKITYQDSRYNMTGVTIKIQGDASNGNATDYLVPILYGDDGTTEIPNNGTLELTNGKVVYVANPLNNGKVAKIYGDVLLIEGHLAAPGPNINSGYIRRILNQKVLKDDTQNNEFIKVTATPSSIETNAQNVTVQLSTNINHGATPITLYDPADVTAKYIITTEADFANISQTDAGWTQLNVGTTNNTSAATTASFAGKGNGTFYIHWEITSGVYYAHSKAVISTAPQYGGFGPYFIDNTPFTSEVKVVGKSDVHTTSTLDDLAVEIDFNKAVKNPATTLTVDDFEIIPANLGTLKSITDSGDGKSFTAILTPSKNMGHEESFTVKLKASSVTDRGGNQNAISNSVKVILNVAALHEPLVAFDANAVYPTLNPSFNLKFTTGDTVFNGNLDTFLIKGGTPLAPGVVSSSLITVKKSDNTVVPVGNYTVTYQKKATTAVPENNFVINFTGALANDGQYEVSIDANKLYNLVQKPNKTASATFKVAVPDYSGTTNGLFAAPEIIVDGNNGDEKATLTIKGKGLKIAADAGLLNLRVAGNFGYDSGDISTGFTTAGGIDTLTITGVDIPVNTTTSTTTHTFTLYQSFSGGAEVSTGKTATVQVEPGNSLVISLTKVSNVVDLPYNYAVAAAKASDQIVTITNNGAKALTNLKLEFVGGQSADFTFDPLTQTTLAPGASMTAKVYLAQGKNVDTYATSVKISGNPSGDTTTLSSTISLADQKVVQISGTSGNGIVTGDPKPSTASSNNNKIKLSAEALGLGNTVNSWSYVVTTDATSPAIGWKDVVGGITEDTYTFAPGSDDTYYVHWKLDTKNYKDIADTVKDGGVNKYVIDLVSPTVSLATTASAAGQGAFDVTATFSEEVTGLAASGIDTTNVANVVVTPVGTDGKVYTLTITPKTNLASSDSITVKVKAAAAHDIAGNPNTESTGNINLSVKTDRPSVVTYGFTSKEVFRDAPTSFDFEIRSNGDSGNPNIYLSDGVTPLSGSDINSITTLTLENSSTPIPVNATYAPTPTGGKFLVTHPSGAFPDGSYLVTVKDGEILNQEGNKIKEESSSFEIWDITSAATGITVKSPTIGYMGDNTFTVSLHGTNLDKARPGSLTVKVSGTNGATGTYNSFTLANGGIEAVFTIPISQNKDNAPHTYTFEGHRNDALFFGTETTVIDAATPTITGGGLSVDQNNFSYMGGSTALHVRGENFHNYKNLKVIRTLDGTLDSTFNKPVTGTPGVNNISLTIGHDQNKLDTIRSYVYLLVDDNNPQGTPLDTETVTVESATAVVNSSGYTVTPTVLDSVGGKVKVSIKGINMHNKLGLRIEYHNLTTNALEKTADIKGLAKGGEETIVVDGGGLAGNVNSFPQNFTDIPQLYRLDLMDDTATPIGSYTVTVKPAVPKVDNMKADVKKGEVLVNSTGQLRFDDKGGSIDLNINGSNLQAFGSLELTETDWQGVTRVVKDLTIASPTTIVDSIKETGLSYPANITRDDQAYIYEIKQNGVSSGVTFVVVVEGLYPKTDTLTANPAELPASGGVSAMIIRGKYLDIFTDLGIIDEEGNVLPVGSVSGDAKQATVTMNFPAWTQGLRNDEYTLWAYSDGGANREALATVVVGDSLPNIQSAEVDPEWYAKVEDTFGGKNKSEVTVHGNYLYNYDSISVHDKLQDDWYPIVATKPGDDRTASGLVTVPSAQGVYEYDIYTNDEFTGITVYIRVGIGLGDSGPDEEKIKELYPGEDLENKDKKWKGSGGGNKGRGFTGRYFIGFDLLEHQSRVMGKANPKAPVVVIPDVYFITRSQLDRAAVAARDGARKSEIVGEGNLTIVFDTPFEEEPDVLEGRLFIDLSVPVPDLYPGVFVNDEETEITKGLFKDRYGNDNIAIVSLGMNSSFGAAKVEVAANVDLEDFDTENLYLYMLDRKTGEFNMMKDTDVMVDDIGFIHFMTQKGGDVIITDKPLAENTGFFITQSDMVD